MCETPTERGFQTDNEKKMVAHIEGVLGINGYAKAIS
jgi:hypothetical protein